jgi:NADPH-dependent 2,4-dienoyl-CoA reductase/sulfur reductase-like enzyme/rhodanese-related sulfurtransferase
VKRDEEYFESVKGIRVLCETEALKIDREGKKVAVRDLKSGEVRDLNYDKLVLGVGASPIVPRMNGIDLGGVYRLYDPGDAQAIRGELDSGVKKIAIIGGGLIGMEVCGAFLSRGCDVSVFEMMDRLVPSILDRELALLLENYLREKGVHVLTGYPVRELEGDSDGRVKGVETGDGSVYDTDMAVIAIGVRPNVNLAREANLEIGETGAIAVNDLLQTSDPEIFAGGDCVENTCMVTGEKVFCPMGSTANKHGRVIGDNVIGEGTTFPGVTRTVVFKILDYNVGKTGLNEMEASNLGYNFMTSLVPRGECANYYPDSESFILKLLAEKETGKILGVQGIGAGEAVKRIDVVASALKFGGTLKDVADIDLCYAPPYSTAIDALAHAGNVIRNKISGMAETITPFELKEKLDGDEEFVLLDIRTDFEVEEMAFRDARFKHIPLGTLRVESSELPEDKEIIIICKSSVRAWEALRILNAKGFKDAKFLEGGIVAWPFDL